VLLTIAFLLVGSLFFLIQLSPLAIDNLTRKGKRGLGKNPFVVASGVAASFNSCVSAFRRLSFRGCDHAVALSLKRAGRTSIEPSG
jgi:hypothetical protein